MNARENIDPVFPRLTIDRLSVVMDVAGSDRKDWCFRVFGDHGDCWELLHCEYEEVRRGAGGYRKACLLKRDGETLRVDYDPWRTIGVRTPVTVETYRGSLEGLSSANGDGRLVTHRRTYKRPDVRYIDRSTGEVLDYDDCERDNLEMVSVKDGEAVDPFEEFYVDKSPLPFLRLEGNPSKFPGFDKLIRHIGEVAGRRNGRSRPVHEIMRPTRVDVAIDYPVPVEHFGVTVERKRRERQMRVAEYDRGEHRNSGRLETLYLGSPSSAVSFRIYDKVAEIIEQAGVKGSLSERLQQAYGIIGDYGYGQEWQGTAITRVEADISEVKNMAGKKVSSVSELAELKDPFASLSVGDVSMIADPTDYREVFFAYTARQIGLNAAMRMLPANTRTRWRKRLGLVVKRDGKGGVDYVPGPEASPILHPSTVFDSQYLEALRTAIPSLLQ